MSMHNIKPSEAELEELKLHSMTVGKLSILRDAFRVGYRFAMMVKIKKVAEIKINESGQVYLVNSNGGSFDISQFVGAKLYVKVDADD